MSEHEKRMFAGSEWKETPLPNKEAWLAEHSGEIQRDYQRLHDEYGDSTCFFDEYEEFRWQEYLHEYLQELREEQDLDDEDEFIDWRGDKGVRGKSEPPQHEWEKYPRDPDYEHLYGSGGLVGEPDCEVLFKDGTWSEPAYSACADDRLYRYKKE